MQFKKGPQFQSLITQSFAHYFVGIEVTDELLKDTWLGS